MRPTKPLDGTCQLVVDLDSHTNTFRTCGKPISGKGSWLYCSGDHAAQARKDYKLTRNAIDLRLHRFRNHLIQPLNHHLAEHYRPSVTIEVGWVPGLNHAFRYLVFHDPDPRPLPTSLGQVHHAYHNELLINQLRAFIRGFPHVVPILRMPGWIGFTAERLGAVLEGYHSGRKKLSFLQVQFIQKALDDRLLLDFFEELEYQVHAIPGMFINSLAILICNHWKVTEDGYLCTFNTDDLCSPTKAPSFNKNSLLLDPVQKLFKNSMKTGNGYFGQDQSEVEVTCPSCGQHMTVCPNCPHYDSVYFEDQSKFVKTAVITCPSCGQHMTACPNCGNFSPINLGKNRI